MNITEKDYAAISSLRADFELMLADISYIDKFKAALINDQKNIKEDLKLLCGLLFKIEHEHLQQNAEDNKPALNFYNCLRLLSECIYREIIKRDPNNKNHILVYRNAGTINPEGWYSENVMDIAKELKEDRDGQAILIQALKEKNVDFKISNLFDRKD